MKQYSFRFIFDYASYLKKYRCAGDTIEVRKDTAERVDRILVYLRRGEITVDECMLELNKIDREFF